MTLVMKRSFIIIKKRKENAYMNTLRNEMSGNETCPFCGSENIFFSKKTRKYKCEDCEEQFEKPKYAESGDEYRMIIKMISEEPPVDVRKVKAFLASSTMLENERSAVTTEIARLNGQKTKLYINMYHCEHDDSILPASSQQEEYNKRIDECDLFLLQNTGDVRRIRVISMRSITWDLCFRKAEGRTRRKNIMVWRQTEAL